MTRAVRLMTTDGVNTPIIGRWSLRQATAVFRFTHAQASAYPSYAWIALPVLQSTNAYSVHSKQQTLDTTDLDERQTRLNGGVTELSCAEVLSVPSEKPRFDRICITS